MFYDSEDVQVFSHGDSQGLIAAVGWIEPNAIRSAAQPLDRVLPIDSDNNDASVDGLYGSIHDQEIAILNPGVFHPFISCGLSMTLECSFTTRTRRLAMFAIKARRC